MLNFLWFKFSFHIGAQSGFYFDYLYKRVAEIFVRLIFIYAAQFFGEKFMIEVWTKKFFFSTVEFFTHFISVTKLNYFWFFFSLLIISVYTVVIVSLFLCFFF